MVTGHQGVGEKECHRYIAEQCNGEVTIRYMESRDRQAIADLLHEADATIFQSSPGLMALVAEWEGRIVAVFYGWVGWPHGHIECFEVDWSTPKRVRYCSMRTILQVYEAVLVLCGIPGWTAWSVNPVTIKWLTRGGAHVTQQAQILSKQWG